MNIINKDAKIKGNNLIKWGDIKYAPETFIIEESILKTHCGEQITIATKKFLSITKESLNEGRGHGILLNKNKRIYIVLDIKNKDDIFYLTCAPLSPDTKIERKISAGTKIEIHQRYIR